MYTELNPSLSTKLSPFFLKKPIKETSPFLEKKSIILKQYLLW